MENAQLLGLFPLVGMLFFLLGWYVSRRISEGKVSKAERLAKRIITDAEKEAEIKVREAKLEAKDEWYKAKMKFEQETQEKRVGQRTPSYLVSSRIRTGSWSALLA